MKIVLDIKAEVTGVGRFIPPPSKEVEKKEEVKDGDVRGDIRPEVR